MNQLRILVVIPDSKQGKKKYNVLFNLGIAYAVAVMEQCGCDVDVIDQNLAENNKQQLLEQLSRKQYEVVATGGTIFDLPEIERIFQVSKQYDPNIINLLGGRIILYDSELIFSAINADYGVIGDVDITLPGLLEKIQTKSDQIIPNTIYKKENAIFKAPEMLNKNPVDNLPYPNIVKCGYDVLYENQIADNGKYTYYAEQNWHSYSIVPGFNCIHHCTFCANNIYQFRTRSKESLMEEMEYAVKQYNTDLFLFAGDIFSTKWDDVETLCSDMNMLGEKYHKKLHSVIPMRIDGFTVEKAKYLKESGCVCVFFGLESYDAGVLKSMRKHISPADIHQAILSCKEARLIFKGNFIFGDIAETKESYMRTLNYWKEHGRGFADIYPIVILPGSQLMDYCIEHSIIKDKLTYYKSLSTNPNYYLLSKRLSPYMTDKEHEKMLNMIVSYFVKYQFYAHGRIEEKHEKEKLCTIRFTCANCSETNIRKGVDLKHGLFSWLVCSHCGARHVVHILPSFLVKIGVNITAFAIKHWGMKIKRAKHFLQQSQ